MSSDPRSRRQPGPPPTIWDRPEPGARRAAYTREQIAEVAIAIADAEGFDAVSMRRVAGELGAGTMTLYHYVKSKDELISLIDNAMMGEILIPPDEVPDDWREGLAEIARRTCDVFTRHPWSFDVPVGTESGPNGTRHFEQSLAVAAKTGLSPREQLEVISMIDDYVFGFALRVNRMRAETSGDPEALAKEWGDVVVRRLGNLDGGEYPHVKQLFSDRPPAEVLEDLLQNALGEDRFERGLQLLLDGIERRIERSA
jgi:AcrR family transcriptional regulator